MEAKDKEKDTINDQKRWMIYGVEGIYIAVIGIMTAFIGWCVENIGKAIVNGFIDSRFHFLPFISPYAFIPFAVHILLGSPDDIKVFGKELFSNKTKSTKIYSNIISITWICITVFLGELVVGNCWDIFFGVELWNYSNLPFQVTQYAGLLPSLGYGLGAYILFKFAYTPILKWLSQKANYKAAKWFVIVVGTLIVIDTCLMMLHIILTNEAFVLWKVKFR